MPADSSALCLPVHYLCWQLLFARTFSVFVAPNTLYSIRFFHSSPWPWLCMWCRQYMMWKQIGNLLSNERSTGSNKSGRFSRIGLRQLKLSWNSIIRCEDGYTNNLHTIHMASVGSVSLSDDSCSTSIRSSASAVSASLGTQRIFALKGVFTRWLVKEYNLSMPQCEDSQSSGISNDGILLAFSACNFLCIMQANNFGCNKH